MTNREKQIESQKKIIRSGEYDFLKTNLADKITVKKNPANKKSRKWTLV